MTGSRDISTMFVTGSRTFPAVFEAMKYNKMDIFDVKSGQIETFLLQKDLHSLLCLRQLKQDTYDRKSGRFSDIFVVTQTRKS